MALEVTSLLMLLRHRVVSLLLRRRVFSLLPRRRAVSLLLDCICPNNINAGPNFQQVGRVGPPGLSSYHRVYYLLYRRKAVQKLTSLPTVMWQEGPIAAFGSHTAS